MGLADAMTERIHLRTYVEGADNVGHEFVHYDSVWAAPEPQGDGRFRFRIRYRPDLRERDDLEPAMHVVYRGETLVLDDIVESVPKVEVSLIAHREIVEDINHLRTGTRRVKSWP